MNAYVNNLRLNGEESIYFVNSIFRPSREEKSRIIERLSLINNTISINKTKRGFEATIDGLDLSFLDELNNEEDFMQIDVKFEINEMESIFINESDNASSIITISGRSRSFCDTSNGGLLYWAA